MVVDYLDFKGVSIHPFEANTPLIVYPDAPELASISRKFLQAIPWQHPKIIDVLGRVDMNQFALSGSLDIMGQFPNEESIPDFFRIARRP